MRKRSPSSSGRKRSVSGGHPTYRSSRGSTVRTNPKVAHGKAVQAKSGKAKRDDTNSRPVLRHPKHRAR